MAVACHSERAKAGNLRRYRLSGRSMMLVGPMSAVMSVDTILHMERRVGLSIVIVGCDHDQRI
jgi:hypothetical protein